MKFNIGLPLLAASIASVAAEGINCEGNARCAQLSLYTQVKNYAGLSIDPNRWYNNGEHIACIRAIVGTGLGVPAHITSCLFLQNSGGAPGKSIAPLINALKDHKCKGCGSVPLFYLQGDNDVSHGELTVNFVEDSGSCTDGVC